LDKGPTSLQGIARRLLESSATTDGIGWIRQNGGEAKDYKGEKLPLHRNWNAFLALLPSCLAEGVKLEATENAEVDGREAIGIKIQGDVIGGGQAVFYFDKKSGLLVKSKRRMQHPLSGQEVDLEVVYSDYKKISGVQYPRRITSYASEKKIVEMEITRIEFLRKIDDRLFDRVQRSHSTRVRSKLGVPGLAILLPLTITSKPVMVFPFQFACGKLM
jgi:hypothetical protein